MATTTDKAIDNLWMSTGDFRISQMTPAPSSKLVTSAGGDLKGKDEKLSGDIVYFVPKDKGKATGAVRRLLRLGGNKYVPAESVAPFYETILANKAKWASFDKDIVTLAQSKVNGETSISTSDKLLASRFDGYGLDNISNADGLDADFDTYKNDTYSNFRLFGIGKPSPSQVKRDAERNAKSITDPNKTVYTPAEMDALYKSSGSKKSFSDWLASDSGHGVITALDSINKIFGKGGADKTNLENKLSADIATSTDTNPPNENTILGMSPITFGIVAVLGIAVVAGGFYMYSHGKHKAQTNNLKPTV